ncbi:uracil-DNA glycosylase [Rhodovulum sulfidophilum]|uniref:uracil-DNA glycosylase n=2 Tax=Rhodovulum sulfidophilum TaxID=35806 RepID=UPI000951FBF6|nr:uracil-DNA glycosylase [Rhodovulum sulfidophilum]OLS48050.1 uracil-DNA glycosylase [Rhodovulum sulfidophilum]
MDPALTPHDALALLAWQVDLGATEAICETPVNRYEEVRPAPAPAPAAAARPGPSAPVPPVRPAAVDPVAVAQGAAAAATDLEGLAAAMAAYELCELKKGARNLVFSDGNPKARVMVIGEAPGRDEDLQGKPFVGRAGHLLDLMFAQIGLGRGDPAAERALYITNVLPWRPPQNRDPEAGEVAMMLPFLERHVDLVDPDILVLMGNHSCGALLGRKGITRLRGRWVEALGRPALPMFHPAYLLRTQLAKRDAWHDLLMLQARLRGG